MSKSERKLKGRQQNYIKRSVTILVVLLVVLSLTNLAFIYDKVVNHAETDFETYLSEYPYLDPARNFIDQEHFITNIQPLREAYYDKVASYAPNEVGIYFEMLNTGANISINQDHRFWPASLIKMPTAIAVMKKVEKREWLLSNELVMYYEDRDDRYGDLYENPAGTTFTIEELLEALLLKSDDTAHRILIRNLSADDYQDVLVGLGMDELFDQNYNITAKEYSRIFRTLYTSSYLKREYSQMLLEWLATTSFDNFLGKDIPDNIDFSHKFGEDDVGLTYLDSGIVYVPNRPFILTVMVNVKDDGGQERAEEIMGELGDLAYEYVSGYEQSN